MKKSLLITPGSKWTTWLVTSFIAFICAVISSLLIAIFIAPWHFSVALYVPQIVAWQGLTRRCWLARIWLAIVGAFGGFVGWSIYKVVLL